MKKSVLALMIASTFGIAIADYRISIPVETEQGGSLPKGSITFSNSTPPVVVPPETPTAKDECMPPSTGIYGWRANKTTGAGSVIWNGTTVGSIPAGGTSVAGASGIVYTKDESSTPLPAGAANLYGICRNIPADFNGGTWVSIAPIQSAWTNSGSAYKCTWTPDANDYLPSQSVEQTGFNCKQLQTSTLQAREQNDSTLVIRNVGSPTNQSRDIDSDENPTRTVAGTDTTSEAETCINVPFSNTSWYVDLTNNNNVFLISWQGATFSANDNLGDITTFTYNGTVYKRGSFLNDLSSGLENTVYAKNYGICRVNH